MPWTAHGVADEQTFRQRTVVVRAGGADREKLAPAARKEHSVVADVPCEHRAVGECVANDPLRKIGTARPGL